jgi:dTDP-4-dehydrorhamnose 3,5-epimerase
MIFTETKLSGVYIVEIEKLEDERGFFARTFDKNEFSKIGLDSEFVQSSISINNKKGTVRGIHYQINPSQTKIVRCMRGTIFDVVVDTRKNSPTYKQWIGIELSEQNYKMLYIPEGLAHGFQTLVDDVEVFYQMSNYYNPQSSKGFRFDDPHIDIKWPSNVTVVSSKDKMLPFFER